MTLDPQTAKPSATVEYFLQTQQPDGSWSDSSSRMDDVEWARERLAARRQKMPQWEQRIVWRATSLAVGVLGDGEPAVSVVPPATNQTALREQVAAALYRHEWPGKQIWEQALAMDRETFLAQADAVLGVLPAPVDRAVVLAEVIARVEAMQGYPRLVLPEEIVAELRRVAAETPQTETQDDAHPAEIECAHCWRLIENRGTPSMDGNHYVHWVHVPGGFATCFPQRGGDSPRAEPRPAVVAQPGKENDRG